MYHKIFRITVIGAAMLLTAAGAAKSEVTTIAPSVTIGERYDTNTSFGESVDDSKTDLITTVTPKVDVARVYKTTTLKGFYLFDTWVYTKNPELNYIAHKAALNVRTEISPQTAFTVNDEFAYNQDTIQVFTVGIQTKRSNFFSNKLSLDMEHHFTHKSTFTLNYANSQLYFSDESFIDSRSDAVSFTGSYALSEKTSFSGSYTYTSLTFYTDPDDTNTVNHSGSLGLSLKLAPTVLFTASLGAVYTDDDKISYNLIGDATLTKTFKQSFLRIGYSRHISDSLGLISATNYSESFFARWESNISKRNTLSLTGFAYKNRSEPEGLLDTESYEASISDTMLVRPWLSVNTGYSYFKQQGEVTGLHTELERNVVFINLTFTPTEWRI